MSFDLKLRRGALLAAVLVLSTVPQAAQAATVMSSAQALFVQLSIGSIVDAGVQTAAAAGASSTGSYSDAENVLTIDTSTALGNVPVVGALAARVTTGVLNASASGNALTPSATAASSVDELAIGLTIDPPLAPLFTTLSLIADTIGSSTTVTGVGPLSAISTVVIEGAALNALLPGLNLGAGVFVNPAANTQVLNLLGVRLVLNEQITTGDGVTSLSRTTNAVHLYLDDFLLGGRLLSGDIVIGNSMASISGVTNAVPEPAVWLQMIVGFGAVGFAMRSRARSTRHVTA